MQNKVPILMLMSLVGIFLAAPSSAAPDAHSSASHFRPRLCWRCPGSLSIHACSSYRLPASPRPPPPPLPLPAHMCTSLQSPYSTNALLHSGQAWCVHQRRQICAACCSHRTGTRCLWLRGERGGCAAGAAGMPELPPLG